MSESNRSSPTTHQRELAAFLRSRRARIDPADAGVNPGTGQRRVAGLRREELAAASDLSIDYYTKLEQGRAGIASPQVRSSLARVLRLDSSEQRYLDLLMEPPRSPTPPLLPRPPLAQLVHNLGPDLAYLLNHRLDIVAANARAHSVLIAGAEDRYQSNLAWLVFGSEHGKHVYVDWRRKAEDVSGILRFALAENPRDIELAELVNDLMAVPAFAHLWRQVLVLDKNHGPRNLRLANGELLHTHYETLRPAADPGFRLVIYTPESASAPDAG